MSMADLGAVIIKLGTDAEIRKRFFDPKHRHVENLDKLDPIEAEKIVNEFVRNLFPNYELTLEERKVLYSINNEDQLAEACIDADKKTKYAANDIRL